MKNYLHLTNFPPIIAFLGKKKKLKKLLEQVDTTLFRKCRD